MPGTDLIEINGLEEELGEISTGEAETFMRNLVAGREYESLDVLGLGVERMQAWVSQVSL